MNPLVKVKLVATTEEYECESCYYVDEGKFCPRTEDDRYLLCVDEERNNNHTVTFHWKEYDVPTKLPEITVGNTRFKLVTAKEGCVGCAFYDNISMMCTAATNPDIVNVCTSDYKVWKPVIVLK
jgi:hypothetical protein